MPIQFIRACTAVRCGVMHSALPTATPRFHSLHRSGNSKSGKAPLADLTNAATRFSALIGLPGTDRLVGAMVLNTVLRRGIGSIGTKSSGAALRFDPMIEPWGILIRSVQPDFLKIGFIKIHEDSCSMTFSDGRNKIELSVTERNYHPSLVALYTNRNGVYHRVSSLIEKLGALETRKKDFEDHCALMEKYGMWNDDTPVATLIEGHQACLSLKLKQMITFLADHKAALAQLKPDAESREYAAVRSKASEKVEHERCIFQRLWISRHDR